MNANDLGDWVATQSETDTTMTAQIFIGKLRELGVIAPLTTAGKPFGQTNKAWETAFNVFDAEYDRARGANGLNHNRHSAVTCAVQGTVALLWPDGDPALSN